MIWVCSGLFSNVFLLFLNWVLFCFAFIVPFIVFVLVCLGSIMFMVVWLFSVLFFLLWCYMDNSFFSCFWDQHIFSLQVIVWGIVYFVFYPFLQSWDHGYIQHFWEFQNSVLFGNFKKVNCMTSESLGQHQKSCVLKLFSL